MSIDGFGATRDLPAIELLEPPVPSGPAPAVETSALTKRYGSVLAVNELDLVVPTGEVFGLIGPNGAGKTTTFSILASLLKSTSGRAVVAGIDVRDDPGKVRSKVGYMPDILGVYDSLQVEEYLRFFASSYRIRKAEWPALIDGLLELVDLTGKRHAMVNSLSRGMKQRLSLARSLVHDPEVLILDEPASGLDPRARVELRELLHELRSMGKTLLISSHILSELEEMCTQIGIMEAGKLLVSGPPQQILDQAQATRRVKVRFADGEVEEHTVADDAEQQALLRRLVVDGNRDVVEFAEVGGGLEDLFLRITQGIVQ